MKIITKLKVNTHTSREQIILGLTEASYVVNVEEKESDRYYKSKDYYIVIREPDKEEK